jgi:hypothetical protein
LLFSSTLLSTLSLSHSASRELEPSPFVSVLWKHIKRIVKLRCRGCSFVIIYTTDSAHSKLLFAVKLNVLLLHMFASTVASKHKLSAQFTWIRHPLSTWF